jgi:hypothetical protein
MLLELLDHHHELLSAVIKPLLDGRNCADVRNLAASCRQIRQFLAAETLLRHYLQFQKSLKNVKSINILSNKYTTIRDYNNKLSVYVCIEHYDNNIIKFKHNSYTMYYVWNSKFNHKGYTISHYIDKVVTLPYTYVHDRRCYIYKTIPPWLQKYNNHFLFTFSTSKTIENDNIYYFLYK